MNLFEKCRFVHRAWRYRARTEPGPTRFMLAQLKTGDTALDIGANKGAYTYWMSRICGPTGHVLAFEPQPELADMLVEAKHSFGFTQLQVICAAVSSAAGSRSLFSPEGNPVGGASLEAMPGPGSCRAVPTLTLDDYLENSPCRPVRFIKCDVEGHEYDVFQGSQRILREDQPLLVFECQDFRHEDGQIQRVVRLLEEEFGYRGFFFEGTRARPLAEFDVAYHQAGHEIRFHDNFCFIPRSESLQKLA